MTAKVFISYRRDDSAGHAGRVHDRLEREFGHDLLFMDVDSIPLGVNFFKVLSERVGQCDVLLAVIGPNWLTVRDDEGVRRLDNPKDFVRIEIATALQRDIPVIPILLDGARIPKADQLPEDLKELTMRNGLDVRHASFHSDMDKLIKGLKTWPPEAQTLPQQSPPQSDPRHEHEVAEAERRRQEAAALERAEAERQRQEVAAKEAAALERAEAERQRQEAAAKEAAARQRAEAERQKQEAAAKEAVARRRAEAERQRQEAAALQRAEAERKQAAEAKRREEAETRRREEQTRQQTALEVRQRADEDVRNRLSQQQKADGQQKPQPQPEPGKRLLTPPKAIGAVVAVVLLICFAVVQFQSATTTTAPPADTSSTPDTSSSSVPQEPVASLGADLGEVTSDVADRLGIDPPRGALVVSVDDTGPAQEAGLQPDDVIVKFQGQDVDQYSDLPDLVAAASVGATVQLDVIRNSRHKLVTLTIGQQ